MLSNRANPNYQEAETRRDQTETEVEDQKADKTTENSELKEEEVLTFASTLLSSTKQRQGKITYYINQHNFLMKRTFKLIS